MAQKLAVITLWIIQTLMCAAGFFPSQSTGANGLGNNQHVLQFQNLVQFSIENVAFVVHLDIFETDAQLGNFPARCFQASLIAVMTRNW